MSGLVIGMEAMAADVAAVKKSWDSDVGRGQDGCLDLPGFVLPGQRLPAVEACGPISCAEAHQSAQEAAVFAQISKGCVEAGPTRRPAPLPLLFPPFPA